MNKQKHSTMKKITTLFVALIFAVSLMAQQQISKSYDVVEELKVNTVSGEIHINRGGNQIKVDVTHTYDDCFEYVEEISGNTVKLKEDFHGRNCNGSSKWTITLPDNVELDISSVSGEIIIHDINSKFELETVSGRIELTDCKGKFEIESVSGSINGKNLEGPGEMQTVSGKISVEGIQDKLELVSVSGRIDFENCNSSVEAETVSGNIEGKNIVLKDEASMESVSGDLILSLGQSFDIDLSMETVSGDAIIDFQGNPVNGTFNMECRKDRGEINTPFKYNTEEEFEQNGKTYIRKVAQLGGSNQIDMKTVSGTIKVKK